MHASACTNCLRHVDENLQQASPAVYGIGHSMLPLNGTQLCKWQVGLSQPDSGLLVVPWGSQAASSHW